MAVPESLIDDAARRFALLSDPTRLRILAVLLEREPLTVGELSDSLGIATPNVSQHLARLNAGRLVSREKQGRAVHYRTTDPNLRPLCELMCASLVGEARRPYLDDRADARQSYLGLRAEADPARAGAG